MYVSSLPVGLPAGTQSSLQIYLCAYFFNQNKKLTTGGEQRSGQKAVQTVLRIFEKAQLYEAYTQTTYIICTHVMHSSLRMSSIILY